jgi:hypothetical protein
MHSQLHIDLARESARTRTEPAGRRRFPSVRARRAGAPRAAAARILPSRAAPGSDGPALGHP